MARKESRARGSLEHEVLLCLAAAKGPLTAADVQAEIGGLAYTTVMTTLSRLHAKAAIERTIRGRAYEYRLVGGTQAAQSNMTAHQMVKLLDEEADRASVLTRFVAALKPEDEQLLTDLLDRATVSGVIKADRAAKSRSKSRPKP
jgi:predicted transcriptional regulator